ncbi:glycosyltransferase [bacterium]|nr:glycosyltransferase [bacterium]
MSFAQHQDVPQDSPQYPSLRVCYFGTYRPEYSRNRIMIDGLRRNGVEVFECHESLWRSIEDRVDSVQGGWKRPAFWWRVLRTYGRLLRKFQQMGGTYDLLIVGYPGQFDVYLARLLSWLRRKPLVWDIFMSIYLISVERQLDTSTPRFIDVIRRVEALACRLPDLLILDTKEYADWFERTHGVAARRFGLVPTGADDQIFQPQPSSQTTQGVFRVLYYGTFIPNHGVKTIVAAARLLAERRDIHFELIGEGPDLGEALRMAEEAQLANVTFTGWTEPERLRQRIADADLCLGVFGQTPQSLMTVQNKIYEGLAMTKPVLSGDGPAVRAAFRHGEEIYLCPRAEGAALAEAVVHLHQEPELRRKLAAQGHAAFLAKFTVAEIGRSYKQHLLALLETRRT